jgi:phosphate starvation-inducible PhoH-like protein
MNNKQRRNPKRSSNSPLAGMPLKHFEPLTANQERMWRSLCHVVAHGSAGTGKTFAATYLALKEISEGKHSHLVYIRSAVATRNMGFLPGTDKEKAEVYETPYKDIASDLFDDVNAYEKLKAKGIVRFMTTSFIRGTTLDNAVIIVDECQNMSMHELDSIITRVGEGCRIFFCGDHFQAGDLGKEVSGLTEFFDILKRMHEFDFIEFKIEDVVRSEFVKNYLIARYKSGSSESSNQ